MLLHVDLHIHTNASDGCWSPNQLIKEILLKQIKIFSVTDHDCISNIEILKELAVKEDLKFIEGVEISCKRHGNIYHILGYGIDINNSSLKTFLDNNVNLSESHDYECAKILKESGHNIDLSQYSSYNYEKQRGGWKLLNFLIDSGICSDADDFLGRVLSKDLHSKTPNYPSPEEAIKIIMQAKGIPVLAHPGYYQHNGKLFELLEYFNLAGIQGIECYHPENNNEATNFCVNFCKRSNLYITGGSDSHGVYQEREFSGHELGVPFISVEQLKLPSPLLK